MSGQVSAPSSGLTGPFVLPRRPKSPLRTFRTKLTAMYAGTAVAMLLIIGVGVTVSVFRAFGDYWMISLPAVRDQATGMMNAQLEKGRSLHEAALYTSAHLGRPNYFIDVFDSNANAVFSGANQLHMSNLERLVGEKLSAPARFERSVVPLQGGFVEIIPNYFTLTDVLGVMLLRMFLFSLLAIAIGYMLATLIAGYATQPLRNFSRNLSLLAEGEYAVQPTNNDLPEEIRTLNAVYNKAAASVVNAVADRERAAEKLRSYVSEAGHELKTPITIISGYLDVLASGLVTAPEDVHRVVSKALGETQRMTDTVLKLNALARLDREEEEAGTFDAAALARDVTETMNSLASNNLYFEAMENEDLLVCGNQREIRGAVVNVVENALKYAPRSRIEVRVISHCAEVMIEVTDDGPGMAADDCDHAFERFYRGASHGDVEGSGLGLAIAKRAVERAHGRITLTSERGRGTAVRFYLPRPVSES